MNFKRFATYMVALSVIALGVWACSGYANRNIDPKSKLDVSVPLLGSDSVVQLASDTRFIAYFNALNFNFLQVRSITETMTFAQVDTYYQELESIGDLYASNTSDNSLRTALVQKMGYASTAAFTSMREDLLFAKSDLMNNCSLLNGMTTLQKANYIKLARDYYISILDLNDGIGKGGVPDPIPNASFKRCMNQVIYELNDCMDASSDEIHAYLCELLSWSAQNVCCCNYAQSCCSSAGN